MKYVYILLVSLLLSACGSSKLDKEAKVKIDQIKHDIKLNSALKKDLALMPGSAVSVAIYHKGKVVYQGAMGTHHQGTGTKVNSDTLFQIGSVNKMFTALATSQLIEKNTIQTGMPLVDALPGIVLPAEAQQGWQQISIHHLLSNQSGLMDMLDWQPLPATLMQAATQFYPGNYVQMNPAGAFYNYSNPNWGYLGAIIEHQSVMPYEEYMHSKVFKPLGMANTTMDRETVRASGNFALSHEHKVTRLEDIPKPVFGLPAGGYTWSTPTDLLKMAKFLLKGDSKVLADTKRKAMVSRQVDEKMDLPSYYGYGITVADGLVKKGKWITTEVWAHDGRTPHYSSELWILPEHDFAFAVVSNSSELSIENTFNKALDTYLKLPAAKDLPIKAPTAQDLQLYAGSYNSAYGPIAISYKEGALQVDAPGLDAAKITYSKKLSAISQHVFMIDIDGVTSPITFIVDRAANQVLIRHRSFIAVKTEP